MSFRCVYQKICKFRVSIEGTNTLDDVTMVKFVSLTGECKLLSNKLRKSIWKLFVDDLVEFIGTRKRQTECACELRGGTVFKKVEEDDMSASTYTVDL